MNNSSQNNMQDLSLIDIAYNVLKESSEPLDFITLFNKVIKIANLSDNNKMAQFYTNLTMDGRFVILPDTKWDLRERHTFQFANPDYSDFELEEFIDEDIEEELEEEEEEELLGITEISDDEDDEAEDDDLKDLIFIDEKDLE